MMNAFPQNGYFLLISSPNFGIFLLLLLVNMIVHLECDTYTWLAIRPVSHLLLSMNKYVYVQPYLPFCLV